MFRIAVVFSFALTACGSDTGTGIVATCPPDSTLTYDGFGALVIEEQCLSCHASKERPLLDTLERVRANRQSILRAAVESTSMPEDAGMSLEEREALGEWLACGAP